MWPTLFRIGDFPIGTYGLMMAIAAGLTFYLAQREYSRIGLTEDQFYSLIWRLIVAGLIGSRLLYAWVERTYFAEHPWEIIFSRSGFVFLGGFALALPIAWASFRQWHVSEWRAADYLAPYLALGHAIGRIGCFLNGCCYGKPTDCWLGVNFPEVGRVYPVQLYESAFLFAAFFVLYHYRWRAQFAGQIFLGYLFLYSLWRFAIEFLRGDERGSLLGWLSSGQEMSIVLGLVALALYGWRWRQQRTTGQPTKT